jgi:hypothetical protein
VHETRPQWRQAFGLSGIAILECQRAPLDVVKISQRPAEGVEAWPLAAYQTEPAEARRLAHRLASGGERRKKKADYENGREPDQPQGHLAEDGWRGV